MGNTGALDKKENALADGQAQGGTQRRGGKSDAAFRTISEVASELDVPQHVLRFWETKFSQIRPMKRGGGRRYYRPEDVVLLTTIRDLLYREGYTIKGVQKLLRDNGAKAVVNALQDHDEDESATLALVGMGTAGPEGGPQVTAEADDDDLAGSGEEAALVQGDEAQGELAKSDVSHARMDVLDHAGESTPLAETVRGVTTGLSPEHRREIEAALETLVALRALTGRALEATRPPPPPWQA